MQKSNKSTHKIRIYSEKSNTAKGIQTKHKHKRTTLGNFLTKESRQLKNNNGEDCANFFISLPRSLRPVVVRHTFLIVVFFVN
jgi:hypothetical protein